MGEPPVLTPDELLTTTRTVRKRLDLDRPLSLDLVKECLRIALQAPNGANTQRWRWIVIADASRRQAIGELYRRAWQRYSTTMSGATTVAAARPATGATPPPTTATPPPTTATPPPTTATPPPTTATPPPSSAAPPATTGADDQAPARQRVLDSAAYLAEHIHRVPVLVIPCVELDGPELPEGNQAGLWGSLLPAAWSYMLAARARRLGTAWTTLHLRYERDVAELLGLPATVRQGAMLPTAHLLGTTFRPAPRRPLEEVLHVDGW